MSHLQRLECFVRPEHCSGVDGERVEEGVCRRVRDGDQRATDIFA